MPVVLQLVGLAAQGTTIVVFVALLALRRPSGVGGLAAASAAATVFLGTYHLTFVHFHANVLADLRFANWATVASIASSFGLIIAAAFTPRRVGWWALFYAAGALATGMGVCAIAYATKEAFEQFICQGEVRDERYYCEGFDGVSATLSAGWWYMFARWVGAAGWALSLIGVALEVAQSSAGTAHSNHQGASQQSSR